MNYGYAGTRELNEALVSRFLVIDMPEPEEDTPVSYTHLESRLHRGAGAGPGGDCGDYPGSRADAGGAGKGYEDLHLSLIHI